MAGLVVVLAAAAASGQSVSSVTLSPTAVTGGATSIATIKLSARASYGGLTVSLSSSKAAATLPSSVTIVAGASSTKVSVTTSAVTSQTVAKITAKAKGSSASASLTIAAPILTGLKINPTSVVSGTTATGTITLSGIAPSGGYKVDLKSSSPLVTVANSVTVSAAATATFPISTDFTPTTITSTITASAGGHSYSAMLTVTPGSPLAASPWPKYNADAGNTGRTLGSGGVGGSEKWEFDFYPGPYLNPVVGPEGNTYVTDGADLMAFSPSSVPLWRILVPIEPAPTTFPLQKNSTPKLAVGADGTLYADYDYDISSGGEGVDLMAVSPTTGKILWLLSLTNEATGSPGGWFSEPVVGANGDIYVSTPNGLVAAKPSGVVDWTYRSNLAAQGSPTVGPDGSIFVAMFTPDSGGSGGGLYAVSSTGAAKWSVALTASSWHPAVGPDGTVYIGNDELSALQAYSSAGKLRLSVPYEGTLSAPVYATASGAVYFWDSKQIRALTSAGAVAWTYAQAPWQVESTCPLRVASDGTVFALTAADRVVKLTATGTVAWSRSYTATNPLYGLAVANNGACSVISESSLSSLATVWFGYVTMGTSNLYNLSAAGSFHSSYLGDSPVSTPVLLPDETVVAVGMAGNVYAVSPQGSLLWTTRLADAVFGSPLAGWDGTIYVGGSSGTLYAIASNGAVKWKFVTKGALFGSPAMGADGTIYVGSEDGHVYALTQTGGKKWAANVGSAAGWTTPAIAADGTIYAAIDGNVDSGLFGLYAIHPDGSAKWTSPAGCYGAPAISPDGTIIAGGGSLGLAGVNPDGSLRWKQGGQDLLSLPGFAVEKGGDVIYTNAMTELSALDSTDGGGAWSVFMFSPYWNGRAAIGADGTVYFGYWNSLYALSPGGGSVWSVQLTNGYSDVVNPIVGNSRVYVLTNAGRLFAVE